MAYRDVNTLQVLTHNIMYQNVPDSGSPASWKTAKYYN